MDGLGRLAREAGVAWLEAHPRETADPEPEPEASSVR